MTDPASIRALIVDDSPSMRTIERDVLEQMGVVHIDEARDGFDALGKLADFEPDLLLIDWRMPNMDGPTFCERFRATGRDAAIIIVTTEAERSLVPHAVRARVSAHVVKPFTPDVLHQRVSETLATCPEASP
jgi:two-component system chemotaxis response regulator CheY